MFFIADQTDYTSDALYTVEARRYLLIEGDGTVAIEILGADGNYRDYSDLTYASAGSHVIELPECSFRVVISGGTGTTVDLR